MSSLTMLPVSARPCCRPPRSSSAYSGADACAGPTAYWLMRASQAFRSERGRTKRWARRRRSSSRSHGVLHGLHRADGHAVRCAGSSGTKATRLVSRSCFKYTHASNCREQENTFLLLLSVTTAAVNLPPNGILVESKRTFWRIMSARFLDAVEKPRVVLETVIEPVVLGVKADEHTPPVPHAG
jgi:hypothetical protein